MVKKEEAGLVTDDDRKKFMDGYLPTPEFPSRFEVKLDNRLNIKGDDGKPLVNPDFGKIYLVGYDAEGNYRREVDIAKTQFFLVRARVACRGAWDKELKKLLHTVEECESGEDIVVHDINGEVVYTGPYKKGKDEFNLSYQQALYVMPVEGGKIIQQAYRWLMTPGAHKSLFPIQNEIGDLAKEGEVHAIKVVGVEPRVIGQTNFNEVLLGKGELLKFDVAVEYWAAFNNFLFQASKEGADVPVEDWKVEEVLN